MVKGRRWHPQADWYSCRDAASTAASARGGENWEFRQISNRFYDLGCCTAVGPENGGTWGTDVDASDLIRGREKGDAYLRRALLATTAAEESRNTRPL